MHETPLSPTFEVLPELLLAGIRQRVSEVSHEHIAELWFRLAPLLGSVPGAIPGIAYGANLSADASGLDYLAAVSVRSLDALPGELTGLALPSRRWASFRHRGHVATLAGTAAAVFARWPEHLGERDTAPVLLLERYGAGFDPLTATGDVDLMVPLKD